MNYLQEWTASCVDDQLTQLNVTALAGSCPSEYLLYSEALPRRNDGRVANHILNRYSHVEQGGWWCSGIDLLTGEEDLWGCFKPEKPRRSADCRKLIKYEHPPKAPTGIFALRVPLHLWQRIAQRYQLEILPSDVQKQHPDLGFWQWLEHHTSIPLCITEGAKKAGALLTAGYVAIALPGVNGGYRIPRDESGNRIGKSRLIPQLTKLAASGRQVHIVFDQDTKPRTIKAVNAAIKKTGYLLSQVGCEVKVVTWQSELGKGVDDLIAQHGEAAWEVAYQKATSLDTWKAQLLNQLTYPVAVELNSRYLPSLHVPETAQLIALKSPKGTGKTKFLEQVVAQAIARQQWVLVLGHRVRLVEELCQRFGLNYITEVKDSDTGAALGYGLCLDSLHPDSQAQFNAENWSDGIVIIDEVEQVLWHGLNSSTCQNNRVAILKSLKTLMQNVLGGTGQVYLADADLSDIALDYFLSLAGVPLQPFIVENKWQPQEEAWQVYNYPESTPKKLVKDLEKHIRHGGKPFVCLSAQKLKSKWGTSNLEAYLQKQFPELKILRIDAESLGEPNHPAYGCVNNLNQVVASYDVVLTSPAVETGISIDLKGHFTSVWAIAQGIQGANSVRQSLSRVRDNVPRHVWIAAYGFNKVGNGSTSMAALLDSGQRLTQVNIRLLQKSDFAALDDLDIGFQAESLICWSKMAVRFNAAMINYRETILAQLRQEGHLVQDAEMGRWGDRENVPVLSLTEAIEAVREQNYQGECDAIASARTLGDNEYQGLKRRVVKTAAQRQALRKYELRSRYGIPVTPTLVVKDDKGWYQKLRLHYFLTLGRPYLAQRDSLVAKQLIEQGQGSVFLPDFNRSQLGAVIGIMEVLGIPVLLANEERLLRNYDADLQAMAEIALNNRTTIKTAVGIGLAKNSTPITIIRRFLDKLGYGLRCLRTETHQKKRIRVYQVVNPQDGRQEVLKYWLSMDQKRSKGMTLNLLEPNVSPLATQLQHNDDNFVQLSLKL